MEGTGGETGGHDDPSRREQEARVSSLALRYRAGEHAVLGELYAELEPLVRAFLRPHLSVPGSLPLGLEAKDLYQQAYVALAEAALQWRPELRDNFLPYFLRSFPWRIDRYLRSQTPSRRTTRFQLRSMPHDTLMEMVADTAGLDGRDWDDALACAEMVRGLPALYGRVVELHLYRGLPFAEVGSTMGISRSAAHEAFGRAISLLRSSLPESASPDRECKPDTPDNQGDGVDRAALRRCVEALHRLAPRGAPLPGREALCRAAGLTSRQHREIMERLRATGCVVGRRRGSAGSLACASAPETLKRLGVQGTR